MQGEAKWSKAYFCEIVLQQRTCPYLRSHQSARLAGQGSGQVYLKLPVPSARQQWVRVLVPVRVPVRMPVSGASTRTE
eukprot:scaffold192299_cov15-Prasinocladus_malaysianus.AAC.1